MRCQPIGSCSDRGDGYCFFCKLRIMPGTEGKPESNNNRLTECQKSTCRPIPLTVKIDMNAAIRKLLIDQGTHFRCMACLFTLPVRFMSIDERYCTDCYQVIHEKDENGIDEVNTEPYAKIPGSNPSVPLKRGRGRPRKELPVNVIETGKTQMECARAAGVSQSTISRRRAAARPMLPVFETDPKNDDLWYESVYCHDCYEWLQNSAYPDGKCIAFNLSAECCKRCISGLDAEQAAVELQKQSKPT